MRIPLNRHEMVICDLMGSIRRKNAMQFNSDNQYSNRDPYDIDIDGFMAEFAVAKYLNVMVDTSINQKKNAVDLIFHGKTIDVKSSRNPDSPVKVMEHHKKNPCNIYILAIIEGNVANIVGWTNSEDLFELSSHVKNQYVLDQHYLRNIESLYVPK